MSKISAAERSTFLGRDGESDDHVRIEQIEGDYSFEENLRAVAPLLFDQIIFLASGWMQSSEEADARSVLGYALLRSLIEEASDGPEVLVELLDPANAQLFGSGNDVMLLSPQILSHLLAHIALRPELNDVLENLIVTGGAELEIRSVQDLDIEPGEYSFSEIQSAVLTQGLQALGLIDDSADPRSRLVLNPDRLLTWPLVADTQIVVLAHQE